MFSLEDSLREGIGLARRGKRHEARQLLAQVVKNDPRSAVGWLWLASVVETKEQRHYCLKRALQLQPQGDISRRILAEIKSEEVEPQPPVPVSSQCFVGYSPPAGDVGGLNEVVERAFAPLGYVPYKVDRGVTGQPLLLNVCQGVFSTRFGVFDLSSGHANTYLELGVALGLNRPVLVVASEGTPLPPLLSGPNVVTYADLPDLEAKLRRLCERGFAGCTTPDYCYFCGRACDGMATPPDENMYLVLHDSKLLWRVVMRSLTPYLAEHHLYPAYLPDRASGPTLCGVREKVLAAQFALCHLGALSNESSFLALGMAIGSRAPWIVLSERGRGAVPQDLQGCAIVEYTTLAHLEERLTDTLGGFLGRIMRMSTSVRMSTSMPDRPAGDGGMCHTKTTVLSLPFWVQLDDWIRHAERPARPSETIQGDLRIVQYEGQAYLTQHAVPPRGLVVGRSPDCDVMVDNPGVSSRHFRVLRGRNGRCFIEDLHSKNGTFLNGSRLPAGQKVELNFNDAVRIPGARFLVWDQRPCPKGQPPQAAGVDEGDEYIPKDKYVPYNTALLPPILKIEIPDVAPPSYLDTWDYSLVLTVRIAGSHHQATFEVQAYYPMGRVLGRIVDLLDLPRRRYRFRLKDTPVGDEETPLSLGLRSGDVVSIVADEPGS